MTALNDLGRLGWTLTSRFRGRLSRTLTRPLRGRPLPGGEVKITPAVSNFLLPPGEGARRAAEGLRVDRQPPRAVVRPERVKSGVGDVLAAVGAVFIVDIKGEALAASSGAN